MSAQLLSDAGVTEEPYVTEEEYFAAEEASPVKLEYVHGLMYAMAGASDEHNEIAANLYGMLYSQLRGRKCRYYGSDMRAKVAFPKEGGSGYYHPDALIACDPTDTGSGVRERPSIIFEIISESTRSVDEREKRIAYLALPTLEAYVRIEQDRAEVVVERRTPAGWTCERISGLASVVLLSGVDVELPLRELYEHVQFPA